MRWVIVALVVSCAKPVATVRLAPQPSSPRPSACELVEALQRAALDGSCVAGETRKRVATCVRTRRGAWGLVVEPSPRTVTCDAMREAVAFGMTKTVEHAHAVHVDAAGVARGPSFTWRSLDAVRGFDYDGDGEDELLVATTVGSAMDLISTYPDTEPNGAIFQRAGTAVRVYPPASHISIDGFTDVDGDGRPDLRTHLDDRVEVDDGDVSAWVLFGPERIAHAVADGSFSLDDATAKNALAASCRKTALAPFEAVVCARIAGVCKVDDAAHFRAMCREHGAMPDAVRARVVAPR